MNSIFVFGFWIIEFCILFFLIWSCIYISTLIYSVLKHAPYVGTAALAKPIIAQTSPRKGQTFIDLGSGDGRMVIAAAKEFGMKGIGYEINPVLVWYSRLRARAAKTDVQFVRKDLNDDGLVLNPSSSTPPIIYTFLLPRFMDTVGHKILKNCPPGTIVIAHGFQIPPLSSKLYKTLESKPFPTYYYEL